MTRGLTLLLLIGLLLLGGWFFFRSPHLPEPDLARSAGLRTALLGGQKVTIVALGDSITAGSNAPFSFLDRLGQALRTRYPNARLELVNSGASGDTAEGGSRRLQSDALRHDPDLVFVEFGWNDLRQGHSESRFEKALSEIVDGLRRESRASVYLMTTTYVDVPGSAWQIRSRNKIIRRIATTKDCGLVDLDLHFKVALKKGVTIRELMSEDRIHPSAKGQELIANAVLRELLGESN